MQNLNRIKHTILTSLVLVLISITSQAQFAKNDVLLGLTFSGSATYTPESALSAKSTNKSFALIPKAGIFLNEHTAAGVLIGYNSSSFESGNSGGSNENKSYTFSAGVFGRRYFTISEKFLFAVEGGLTYGRNNLTNKSIFGGVTTSNETNSYTLQAYARPILVFMASPNWSFEGSIGLLNYSHNQSLSTDVSSNNVSFSAGGLSLGVVYYFRGSAN